MFFNVLRKSSKTIQPGVHPDLELKAIEMVLSAGTHEFKEATAYPYDVEDLSKKIFIGVNALKEYAKTNNMQLIPQINDENGFDIFFLYPKKAV